MARILIICMVKEKCKSVIAEPKELINQNRRHRNMVHINEAIVVCDFCWKHIKNERVYSPTPEKLVKVVFELCSDCKVAFGYTYDEFATTFAIASFLLWKNIPEKILMRDF